MENSHLKYDIDNRQRLLEILRILYTKTDAAHGKTLRQIVDDLKQAFGPDFRVTSASLRRDLTALDTFGIGIDVVEHHGQPSQYKWAKRIFDFHELRILVDAVASAHFLTKRDTESLITKLTSLTSGHEARKLGNHLFVADHVKTMDEKVKYSIAQIHQAMLDQRKISFQYQKYNLHKEMELQRQGALYMVEPYALVWNTDYYYLLAKQDGIDQLKTFRVDRLVGVQLLEEGFHLGEFNAAEYVNKTFNMYPGDVQLVRIQFDYSLLNVVMDRFGTGVSLYPVGNNKFVVIFEAAVSEGLIRWLLTWGADAKVLSPPELVERMGAEVEKMSQLYI